MNQVLPKIITVVGPTASGKTSLGVFLSQKFNGEIISADSRQVYRGLNIGTGKEGIEDQEVKGIRWLEGIPQYLVDIKNPEERFSVGKWRTLAEEIIADIVARGKLPIVVGGTGLYADALVENYQFGGRHNKSRGPKKYQVLQIGVDLPRDVLYQRIDQRVEDRLKIGLLEEVQRLIDQGVSSDWLIKLGLEYKFLTEHLIGIIPDRQEAIQKLKYAIHHFARRQLIWFRYHGAIEWVKDKNEASLLVRNFLKAGK